MAGSLRSPMFRHIAEQVAERHGVTVPEVWAAWESGRVFCAKHGVAEAERYLKKRHCAACLAEREQRVRAMGRGQ